MSILIQRQELIGAKSASMPLPNTARPSKYLESTRFLNRVIAALLLMITLPLIIVVSIVIKLTSKGPAVYRQLRVGLDGRQFLVCKLRTMRHDAESLTGPVWAKRRDPRVTSLGRVLRKLHIDELPQLWNVVVGEMALIGPRPERPEFVVILAPKIPGYLNRLSVLPGITGLAQILLPPDSDMDSVRHKLIYDLDYIERANPWTDLRILACTSLRLCGIPGTMTCRLLGFRLKNEKNASETTIEPDTCRGAVINSMAMQLNSRSQSPKSKKPR